jgi:choline dehydrogenase-like flavoprotein
MEKFLASDPSLVAKLSALGHYDYVIVGSGIGGGILAEELVKKQKRVLLIERGGLIFSTHVCNTARPDYSRGMADSPEGNELVYAALKANIQTAEGSEQYVGGPMYCLGGRSNVWGLWCPKADVMTLDEYFPVSIATYLKEKGYRDVFNLMTEDSQIENIYPKDELLKSVDDNEVNAYDVAINALREAIKDYVIDEKQLDLGPIATQLISPAPYRFPQGAYSTTGPLLNRMYARDKNLTVLLETEVIEIEIPKPEAATIPGR